MSESFTIQVADSLRRFEPNSPRSSPRGNRSPVVPRQDSTGTLKTTISLGKTPTIVHTGPFYLHKELPGMCESCSKHSPSVFHYSYFFRWCRSHWSNKLDGTLQPWTFIQQVQWEKVQRHLIFLPAQLAGTHWRVRDQRQLFTEGDHWETSHWRQRTGLSQQSTVVWISSSSWRSNYQYVNISLLLSHFKCVL